MPVFDIDPRMFRPLSLQEGSPFGGVLSDAIAKRMAMAQAQKEETAAKYAERKTLADILHQELTNEWLPKEKESEIGLRKAQIPHLEAQTKEIMEKLPWISKEKAAEIAYKNASTQKTRLDIESAIRDREAERQIQDIISGRGSQPTNQTSASNYSTSGIPNGSIASSILANTNPSDSRNRPMNEQPSKPSSAQYPSAINEQPSGILGGNEKVIDQGNSRLANIDDLYDTNPSARSYLEKKGFKKTQQIKIDKSGKATIVTKYPSGKIVMQTEGNIGSDEIPLTNKMVSQHQNIVSSIDVAIPALDKIIDLKNNEYSRAGGWTTKGAKYNGLVKQALDSVLGAFGLPQTNEGIKSILDQLEIGHGESATAYRKRIEELKKDLLKRQKYSANLVKKGDKYNRNEEENDKDDPYNLGNYDLSGE